MLVVLVSFMLTLLFWLFSCYRFEFCDFRLGLFGFVNSVVICVSGYVWF